MCRRCGWRCTGWRRRRVVDHDESPVRRAVHCRTARTRTVGSQRPPGRVSATRRRSVRRAPDRVQTGSAGSANRAHPTGWPRVGMVGGLVRGRAAGPRWCPFLTLEMGGASPQRLLSEDPGDLAGVTRQGNGEGVLTLSETERSALLASTFEVAAKGAVERCGVEAGYP